MLGTYDMATSHACDIVWQSWRDLGLVKGKGMAIRSSKMQQASWGGAPIVGGPPEIVVGAPYPEWEGCKGTLGVQEIQEGAPMFWHCCSVAEQESLGQRAGKGSSYNCGPSHQ